MRALIICELSPTLSFFYKELMTVIYYFTCMSKCAGKEFNTYAKVIVNAAGPFCDSVRKLADKDARAMISPSSGVHIVLPDYYSPEGMGLIVPKTKDGRVVFMLPWLGRTVAGTTDSSTTITLLPEPHEDEIQFILDAISDYLNVKVCYPYQYLSPRCSFSLYLLLSDWESTFVI